MMLGFVSAILPDLSLEEVIVFADEAGYECVEVMCWPTGKADRRYAGVTHLDVTRLEPAEAARIRKLCDSNRIAISGLGYYPNVLSPDAAEAAATRAHLEQVIRAAPLLGIRQVNTFIGRDWRLSVDDNWPRFLEVWQPLVRLAEECQVRIGIENCPMLFSLDEWPGGANLATTPAIWTALFEKIPTLGLNFDPSHLIWQNIDVARCIRDFGKHFVHVHAKDTRIDADKLYQQGNQGLGWHTPKLPGLGDVNWSAFFSALTDTGYQGAICIEVEDRAYEGSLDARKCSLRQSKRYLEQFM